jgi:predicted nucleic acid-binding protein
LVLVDTNVLLDVVQDDPEWGDWSQRQFEAASLRGPLAISAVIYAELSMAYRRIEDLDSVVQQTGLQEVSIPREALFLAGKAFLQYRRRKGGKKGVLPDFFIGAHAAISGMPILTRDIGRYRTYFPRVELLGPV